MSKDILLYEKQLNNATFLSNMGEKDKAIIEYKKCLTFLSQKSEVDKKKYSEISYKISLLSKNKNYFDEIMFIIFAKNYGKNNKDIDKRYMELKMKSERYLWDKLSKLKNYEMYEKFKREVIKHPYTIEKTFYKYEKLYLNIFFIIFLVLFLSFMKTDLIVMFFCLSIISFIPIIYFFKKTYFREKEIYKIFQSIYGIKDFILYLLKKYIFKGAYILIMYLITYFFISEGISSSLTYIENNTLRNQNRTAVIIREKLTLTRDKIPPKIIAKDFSVKKGEKVDFKHRVKIIDNWGKEGLKISVDKSRVNLNKEGKYKVEYIARDSSLNETKREVEVIVKDYSKEKLMNRVNKMAKKILSTIINDNMSEYDKAKNIFWWTHDNITYKEIHDKKNLLRNAELGLFDREGDCYVFAYTAQSLLSNANINNMIIERKKGVRDADHLWLIINIGEGWYHFDCMKGRSDNSVFFYEKSSTLLEYDSYHPGYFTFDKDLYPPIN